MNKDTTNFTPKLPSEIFDGLPEAVHFYISSLETVIQQQQHQIEQQKLQMKQLEPTLRSQTLGCKWIVQVY